MKQRNEQRNAEKKGHSDQARDEEMINAEGPQDSQREHRMATDEDMPL